MKTETKTCSEWECENTSYAKGVCRKHYDAANRAAAAALVPQVERYSPDISRKFTSPKKIRPQEETVAHDNLKDPNWDPYENPLSFWAIRHIVSDLWGSPEDHPCHICWQRPAYALAYDYKDPYGEIREEIRRAWVVYSPDPCFFSPMCRGCIQELRETYALVPATSPEDGVTLEAS